MQGGSHSLRKLRRDWWKTRLCTSCITPLGRILSRGNICPQCGLRVCKDCRSELQPGTGASGAWICVLCSSGGMLKPSRSREAYGERASDNLVKGSKSLGRDSRSIRRSWTISNPQRAQTNSPILKSYTILHPEESGSALNSPGSNSNNLSSGGTPASHHRQFHSLPRMNTESDRSKKVKRSFNSEFEKENIKRHRSFQTTLHPYQVGNPPSPSASIKFIEDPFWDYYDYENTKIDSPSGSPRSGRIHRLSSARSAAVIMSRRNSTRKREAEMDKLLSIRTNSNRSSCERSLGESMDYDFSLKTLNNFSLSDTELNENSKKYDSPTQEQLAARRFSTESSNNFYRFATITPINMSPLNDTRRENVNKLHNQHIQHLMQRSSPVKPERKSRRSMSLNSYDTKKLFSPLRTYCVLTKELKENVVPRTNNISNADFNATTTTSTETNNSNTGNYLNTNGKNTSSVFINPSSNNTIPSSSNIPSPADKVNSNLNATRFHSLPRERVIRIEREDGKFARAGTNTSNQEDRCGNKNNNRKTSIVEISRSASSASAIRQTPGTKNTTTTRVPITIGGSNGKIQRSQSYREISSSKPQEVPSVINVRLEKNSSPYSGNTSTLPLNRNRGESKEPFQKPYFDSILDDKNSISVMENFLRTSQNQKAKSHRGNNENNSQIVSSKDSPNKSNYIQSHMNDFENFQREQIQTFDNYLRQCSSLPRAGRTLSGSSIGHNNKSVLGTRLGTEPKHVSKTTISDDNLRKFEDLDAYFHPLNSKNNDHAANNDHKERILPIVVVNGGGGPGSAGWSATLPHPYIRRHKQQKSSFLEQNVSSVNENEKAPSPSINEIEQEIERDIYFQKTKSLDRHRPKPSTLVTFGPTEVKQSTTTTTNDSTIPPVASPRLRRKARLASNPNLSSPKINAEQFHSQEYVSGLGTNYQPKNQVQSSSIPNKNNSRLPNELVQTPDHFNQYPITTKAINHSATTCSSGGLKTMPVPIVPISKKDSLSKMHKDFILESQSKVSHQSLSSSPQVLSSSSSPSERSKMKMSGGNVITSSTCSNNPKSASNSAFIGAELDDADLELKLSSRPSPSALSLHQNQNAAHLQENDEAQQVFQASEQPPPPIATPRARRKNSNQHHRHNNNEQEHYEVGSHNNNFNSSQTQISSADTMDVSKSQSNLPKAVRFEPHVIEMEMENERKHNQAKAANNNINVMRMNNKLRQHLVTSSLPVSSSHHGNPNQPGVQIYTKHNALRNKGNIHHYTSGSPKNHNIHHQYHYHGGVKSSKASGSDKKQRSQAYGFVARAIAKVKGKAKGKSISNNSSSKAACPSGAGDTAPITNTSSGIQSVETRDSITYISPPPTQQQQQAGEISPILLSHSQPSILHGISRTESFNKSVIKHEAEDRNNKHSIMQDSQNQNNSAQPKSLSDSTTKATNQELGSPHQELKSILSSPTKPKRSSIISMDPLNNQFAKAKSSSQQDGSDQNGNDSQFHGLISDQLTPSSSSSSSSSSYLSNLQESYDFFHESEECESISDPEETITIPAEGIVVGVEESDEEDDQEGVFKSFEDDEDAGEDFIFYSNQTDEDTVDDQERRRTSHAYNGPANPNATGVGKARSSINTTSSTTTSKGIPIPKSHSSSLYNHKTFGGDYHKKGEDEVVVSLLTKKELRNHNKKGLAAKDQVENNGNFFNQRHPQQQLNTYRVTESNPTLNDFNKEQVPTTSSSRLSDLTSSSYFPNTEDLGEHVKVHGDIETTATTYSHQPVQLVAKVPQAKTLKQKDNRIDGRVAEELQQSQKFNNNNNNNNRAQYGTNTLPSAKSSHSLVDDLGSSRPSSLVEDGHFINPIKFKLPKPNNLLLPSSFIKSATLPGHKSFQNFNESEFFPGESSQSSGGMSSLLGDIEGGNTSQQNQQGRFKSRVLVNEESKPPVVPLKGKKKNVTRVDISGDVGIVTTNTNNNAAENAFLKDRRAQLKKTNENLWMNDVYSSGLTQLSNQNQTNQVDSVITTTNSDSKHSEDEENNSTTTSLDNNVGSFDNETESGGGSTIGSSSDNVTLTGGSDDGSSDWHSESTKNTVIFRGDPNNPLSNSSKQWPPSPSDLAVNEGFNYNCDPEIHISSITLVDSVSGNGVTSSSSPTTTDTNNLMIVKSKSNEAREMLNKSLDDNDKERDIRKNVLQSLDNTSSITNNKFEASQDVSRTLSTSGVLLLADSSVELAKSNETLTGDLEDEEDQDHPDPIIQMPEDPEEEIEMVQPHHPKSANQYVPNNNNDKTSSASFHQRRESPEGQEQEVPSSHPDKDPLAVKANNAPSSKKALEINKVIIMEEKGSPVLGKISKSKISQNALSQITSRSSPDGADAERSEGDTTEPDNDSPTPMIEHFDVTSDEDSWVEEISFEDEYSSSNAPRKQLPPPLDLTLHTIVEESCEESEAENSGNFNQQPTSSQRRHLHSQQNDNELEKYFNFGIYNENNSQGGRNSLTNEESEFSDTFSESSFSLQDDELGQQQSSLKSDGKGSVVDPAELASSRLEKYFYNLGLPQSMINPISSINQTADSDSVGSESESDNSVLEKRKKVLKHHRRSADFEDEEDEEEDFGFGQDGFDTIKKTARKVKKSGSENSNLLETATGSNSKSVDNLVGGGSGATSSGFVEPSSSGGGVSHKDKDPLEKSLSAGGTSLSSKEGSTSTSPTSPSSSRKSSKTGDKPVIKVNRSNSFTWSSDEEVNIMMSKFRQLIKSLIKSKMESNAAAAAEAGAPSSSSSVGNAKDKDKQLAYLENELIRLMKSENLKNIVEYLSSEESDVDDVYKFIRVVKESGSISNPDDSSDLDLGDLDLEDPNLFQTLQTTMQAENASHNASPKGSPALLAKVMNHIGNRLALWMKDENLQEEDNNDDSVTLKCAQSVSSDLNEDRFSWKGSFESALAAKRQSVGSTDSISSSDFTQDRSILRSSSLHHLANSSHHLGQVEEHKEEEETGASSLPRMTNLCNSLPRLNQPSNLAISRAHSLVMSGKSSEGEPVKSARYRPPGFQPVKSKRMDDEGHNSPILSQSTPVLTQDPGNLKVRSDSMGSIFHDTKPHISVKGQVEFGLQYNYKLACLEVRVKQCHDLAAVDSKRNRSDPYVKAYLLPDRSKNGKRKTKTKKNTLNPVFDEILKFPLTLSDLQNRTLWLSVWSVRDIFGKNEFLGEVLVDLKDRVFDETNPICWDLQEMSGQTEEMPRGDVVIALKWQPKTENTGNLSVLVKEAKNVVSVKNASPSTFIKCTMLTDKSRKQKSSICRRSCNPIWNQTMNFEDVDDEGIEITLWNHDLLSNHDLLGTVRVEKYDNPLWESMLARHSFWVEGGLRLN